MINSVPVEKNKEYIVEVTGEGYEGEGVARIDNYPIFIHGAIIGEKVKIKIVKVKKKFAFGKLVDVINESKDRVVPVCPIYNKCGGCSLQHFSYSAQLNFKTNRVKDVLQRIGKIKDYTLHDTIGMENPYRYRNKVQLPVGGEEKNIKIGFYAPRSHNIIEVKECYIQKEVADKVILLTKNWMEKFNIKPYNEEKNTGLVRHIMVRCGFKTDEIMVAIVTNKKVLPHKDEFVKTISENIEGIKSIVQNVNSKKTNVILGNECITLYGEDHISDYIGEFKFNISPLSFFQVNPIQTQVLYNKALEYANLKGDETVFDAYCGTGTISLFLSQKAKMVYGVEIIKEAIENAEQNAKENNIDNVHFSVGKSEEVIPELINKGIKADVVVVDPPRKGCDEKLLKAISDMKPSRVVYVSCDPSTLARDLNIMENSGYKVQEVQPVDMFPETGHVECVVLMFKK